MRVINYNGIYGVAGPAELGTWGRGMNYMQPRGYNYVPLYQRGPIQGERPV